MQIYTKMSTTLVLILALQSITSFPMADRLLKRNYLKNSQNIFAFNSHILHIDDQTPMITSVLPSGKMEFEDSHDMGPRSNYMITNLYVHGTEFLVKIEKKLAFVSFIQKYGTSIYSKTIFLNNNYSNDREFNLENVFMPSMDYIFFKSNGKFL